MFKFRATITLIILSVFLWSCSDDNSTGPETPGVSEYLDRSEAKLAFEYLNKVRVNPDAYSQPMGVDLSYVDPRATLVWNDILQKVAEEKALDLVNRNYFAHVNPDGYAINYYMDKAGYPMEDNWISKPTNNYFESLAANSTPNMSGQAFIDQLIIDEGVPSLGHRKHLLGIDSVFAFNSTLDECGFAVTRKIGTTYTNYIVCIIAKKGVKGKTIFTIPITNIP